MNIQEALKETGKAEFEGFNETYHHVGSHNDRPDGKLRWFDIRNVCLAGEVVLSDLLSNYWQPYHPKEEIRPELVAEVWERKEGNTTVFTHDSVKGLILVNETGGEAIFGNAPWHKLMIHGENGWTRLRPSVPDDSVEEIVIEGVTWDTHYQGFAKIGTFPKNMDIPVERNAYFDKFTSKPPMTMKLTIPKENANVR